MMMFLKLETDKKTKKNMSTVNMHMQTKFFPLGRTSGTVTVKIENNL